MSLFDFSVPISKDFPSRLRIHTVIFLLVNVDSELEESTLSPISVLEVNSQPFVLFSQFHGDFSPLLLSTSTSNRPLANFLLHYLSIHIDFF